MPLGGVNSNNNSNGKWVNFEEYVQDGTSVSPNKTGGSSPYQTGGAWGSLQNAAPAFGGGYGNSNGMSIPGSHQAAASAAAPSFIGGFGHSDSRNAKQHNQQGHQPQQHQQHQQQPNRRVEILIQALKP